MEPDGKRQDGQRTRTWKEYESALKYQHDMGFDSKFPEYERFRQGDQWPAPTERTKNLPRPVFNIVKFFLRSKEANVLNQTVKMVFSPTEVPRPGAAGILPMEGTADRAAQGAKDYTDFAAALWEDVDQDALNEDFVDDAAANGTGVLHYYWDSDVSGGMSVAYRGDLRGEVIDPLNIFFGNPQERRVQRQPWVMISKRESVEAVRRLAKANGVPAEMLELIQGDDETRDEGYDAAQHEMDDADKVTVLTKYFRSGGEVCFCKATKAVDVVPETPLTPRSAPVEGEDGEEMPEPDTPLGRTPEPARITLYPIVVLNWEKRKKSIFGAGEVESVIPNQKAINFNIAMMLLSTQQTAWPKLLAKPGALRDEVTNEPGEILVDYFGNGGDGIKYMQPPNLSSAPVGLAEKVFELSRTTEGVNEVSSGEPFTANMAASAIIALQNQAKQPIERIQKRFYRAVKEVGKVWEQFFKTYYSLARNMTVEDEDGNEQTRPFLGTQYADVEFKLRVDVGAGSAYSEALTQSILDKLHDMQQISTAQYVELLPQNVLPCKAQLKKMLMQVQPMPPGGMETPGTTGQPPPEMVLSEILGGGGTGGQMPAMSYGPANY